MKDQIIARRHHKSPLIFTYEEDMEGGWGSGFFNRGRKHIYQLVLQPDDSWMPIWVALCYPEVQPDGSVRHDRLGYTNILRIKSIEFRNGSFVFNERGK